MLSKYIKSLNLNEKGYNSFRQPTLTSARIKTSRKYLKNRRSNRNKRLLLIFLLFVLLAFCSYIIFFSSVFKIKNIKIDKIINYNLITKEEVKASLQNFINQSHNNLIFLKCAKWQEEISDDPRLEFFSIRKRWPDSIEIKLQETKPLVILRVLGDNQPYYLNKRGKVIKAPLNAMSTELEGLNNGLEPIFYDQSRINVKSKIYADFLEKLLIFVQNDTLSRNKIHIKRVNLNNIGNIFDVQITTNEGWQIFINSEVDLEKQLISLLQILEEEIENQSDLEYIDLRFGTKMFYKLKEQ